MQITEVKVRLVEDRTERLRAFCTVTLDREFVIRDIKVIDGARGLFVAMPSRKVTDHCTKCGAKNHLRAKFCSECGTRLPGKRTADVAEGSSKLHVDVAHPINSECRTRMEKAILDAYEQECKRAGKPTRMASETETTGVPPQAEPPPPPVPEQKEPEAPAAAPPESETESESGDSEEAKPFGQGVF